MVHCTFNVRCTWSLVRNDPHRCHGYTELVYAGILLSIGDQLMDDREALTKFEKYIQRRFPGRRTVTDYLCDVRQFRSVCQKPWREVNLQDMDAFVDQQRAKGLKQATKRSPTGMDWNGSLEWVNLRHAS